jgi:ABC-type polysaccharide/polyol phosphate transport system ATPase subunit
MLRIVADYRLLFYGGLLVILMIFRPNGLLGDVRIYDIKKRWFKKGESNMEVLRLKGITQEFGGLRALDSVDLTVKSGQIFGIIGPNGAGKTTLFNIITGIYVPVEGTIRFRDQDMKGFRLIK